MSDFMRQASEDAERWIDAAEIKRENRELARSTALRGRWSEEDEQAMRDFYRRTPRWAWLIAPFILAIPLGALTALLAMWLGWFGLAVGTGWMTIIALYCALKAGLTRR